MNITTEQIFVIAYLGLVLVLGLLKRSKPDAESYLFAGRKLTLPAFIATLVTTWYGGILEVGRFSFRNGIVTWIIFGFFYYIAAYLFARYIAPFIAAGLIGTIPEYLRRYYGKKPAIIGIIFVILIVSPAPYLKMLGSVFQHLWDMNELTALIIGTVFSLLYAFEGGFSAVVRTDKLQFVLMFGGFAMILFFLVNDYGTVDFLINNTPDYAFSIPGNLNFTYIFAWGFIALLTFLDPGFYQRSFSGSSIKTVQKGIKVSIIFWVIFDFMTITTGIYASAILPADIQGSPYLELASLVLSPVARGLFIVSLMAIIMSTIDSYSFISAFTFGKDLPEILGKENHPVNLYTKLGLLFTAFLSVILAYIFPHAIDIWYTLGTFAIPVLLIPIFAIIFDIYLRRPLLLMIISSITTFAWYFIGMFNKIDGWNSYPFGIEPVYPGLFIGVILFLFLKK